VIFSRGVPPARPKGGAGVEECDHHRLRAASNAPLMGAGPSRPCSVNATWEGITVIVRWLPPEDDGGGAI